MTTIQDQIKKLEGELQHLKEIVATQTAKVDIEEGDFAFYGSNMYFIVRNNGKYPAKDNYIGVRADNSGVSWLRLKDAGYFAKHTFSGAIKVPASECNVISVA